MALLHNLLRRPRSSWLWKFNFQLHLYVSLILTVYVSMIGITGSILVFRVELERLAGERPWPSSHKPRISVEEVLESINSNYGGRHIVSVVTPTADEPLYITTIQGLGQHLVLNTDPQTGEIRPVKKTKRSWIDWAADLHTTLLIGREGRIVNGVGAVLLLLINLTGLIIWWPGIKLWMRGLTIDFGRKWRRVNFDMHRAVGFWALSIISAWAISGIYFAWPAKVFAWVNSLSPIVSARPPVVRMNPVLDVKRPEISSLIARAYQLDPGTSLAGINFPYSRRAPFEVLMQRSGGIGREYTDVLYFNPWDGKHLYTWRYGVNQSFGDWFIWLQVPLHFGTFWGLGVKVVWAVLGLTIPLLAVTGVLMYWNRVLRHKQ